MDETKPHILIIDNDPSILEMMRLVLEGEAEYHVTTMETVFENVAEVEQLQPDLILLDCPMKRRQTARILLQKFKLHRRTKDIPIVLCTTGLPHMKKQGSIFTQEVIPILYKPFDVDELLHIVEHMLSSSPHMA